MLKLCVKCLRSQEQKKYLSRNCFKHFKPHNTLSHLQVHRNSAEKISCNKNKNEITTAKKTVQDNPLIVFDEQPRRYLSK